MKIILTGESLAQPSVDFVVVKVKSSLRDAEVGDSISGDLFITTKPDKMLVAVGGELVIEFEEPTEEV